MIRNFRLQLHCFLMNHNTIWWHKDGSLYNKDGSKYLTCSWGDYND